MVAAATYIVGLLLGIIVVWVSALICYPETLKKIKSGMFFLRALAQYVVMLVLGAIIGWLLVSIVSKLSGA